MGGSAGPRVHGPQPVRRGHPRPVRLVRLRREPQIATVGKPEPPAEEALPTEEVETPGRDHDRRPRRSSSASPESRTAKAAFFVTGDGRFVMAIVRGDFEVNETKLANAVKAVGGLRPAQVDEIKAARDGARLRLADRRPRRDRRRRRPRRSARRTSSPARTGTAATSATSTSPRDFTPDVVADIANAREGDPCPRCGSPVKPAQRASRSATSSSSGPTSPSRSAPTTSARTAREHPVVMGSYGIGLGRNVACIVEAHHDEKGIIWPAEVAPYAAHLVSIGGAKDPQVDAIAAGPPRAALAGRPRDPLRRPRRVARRQVHRRRAARDAVDRDDQPALAGRRRGRGHRAGDRRAVDPPAGRGRGLARRTGRARQGLARPRRSSIAPAGPRPAFRRA